MQTELAILDKQRTNELDELKKLDRKELYFGERYHCIYSPWLKKLLQFLRGENDDIPGPIDNSSLLAFGSSDRLRIDAKEMIDYKKVAPPVWNFLFDIYGGGPLIKTI